MRGIGNGYGGIGLMGLGAALGLSMSAGPLGGYRDPFSPLGGDVYEKRGTGWQDRPFEHPQGKCEYKPTGSKRSRRRQQAKNR